jgi:hypothetical protein
MCIYMTVCKYVYVYVYMCVGMYGHVYTLVEKGPTV